MKIKERIVENPNRRQVTEFDENGNEVRNFVADIDIDENLEGEETQEGTLITTELLKNINWRNNKEGLSFETCESANPPLQDGTKTQIVTTSNEKVWVVPPTGEYINLSDVADKAKNAVEDAPNDGKVYARKNESWEEVEVVGGVSIVSITQANYDNLPIKDDNTFYDVGNMDKLMLRGMNIIEGGLDSLIRTSIAFEATDTNREISNTLLPGEYEIELLGGGGGSGSYASNTTNTNTNKGNGGGGGAKGSGGAGVRIPSNEQSSAGGGGGGGSWLELQGYPDMIAAGGGGGGGARSSSTGGTQYGGPGGSGAAYTFRFKLKDPRTFTLALGGGGGYGLAGGNGGYSGNAAGGLLGTSFNVPGGSGTSGGGGTLTAGGAGGSFGSVRGGNGGQGASAQGPGGPGFGASPNSSGSAGGMASGQAGQMGVAKIWRLGSAL